MVLPALAHRNVATDARPNDVQNSRNPRSFEGDLLADLSVAHGNCLEARTPLVIAIKAVEVKGAADPDVAHIDGTVDMDAS